MCAEPRENILALFAWWKMYALDSMDEMCLCVPQQYVFKWRKKNLHKCKVCRSCLFFFCSVFYIFSLYFFFCLVWFWLWHLLHILYLSISANFIFTHIQIGLWPFFFTTTMKHVFLDPMNRERVIHIFCNN